MRHAARNARREGHSSTASPYYANNQAALRAPELPRRDGRVPGSPLPAPGSASSAAQKPPSSPRWIIFTPTMWVSITPALTS